MISWIAKSGHSFVIRENPITARPSLQRQLQLFNLIHYVLFAIRADLKNFASTSFGKRLRRNRRLTTHWRIMISWRWMIIRFHRMGDSMNFFSDRLSLPVVNVCVFMASSRYPYYIEAYIFIERCTPSLSILYILMQ